MRNKRYYADPACQICSGVGLYRKGNPDCPHCKGSGKSTFCGFCEGAGAILACGTCLGKRIVEKSLSDTATKHVPCPDCNGTGAGTHPIRTCASCVGTGTLDQPEDCVCTDDAPMTPCECHKAQLIRVMTESSQIPEKYLGSTVAHYIPETTGELAVKEYVTAWVTSFPKSLGKAGMFLHGAPGTGKTHLVCAIGQALIKHKGVQPLYVPMTELVRKIHLRISDKEIEDPLEVPMQAHVLIIDDMGADHKAGEYLLGTLAELFDYRYRNNLPTIYTSNLDLDMLESVYAYRIPDRIHETCKILHCDGRSRRRDAKQ